MKQCISGISTRLVTLLSLIAALSLFGCRSDDDVPEPNPVQNDPESTLCEVIPGSGTEVELEIPYFFAEPNLPQNNPLTEEGIELGRHLFWETALSRNNAVSCGSCHFPEASFSDNAPFSTGLYGDQTHRNSMAIVNLVYNNSFFWDGRASTLEEQLFEPVRNPIEMDMTWAEASERISSDSTYQEMFTQAFGTPCVDSIRITNAMAQFIRTMLSHRSKFDRAYRYGELVLTPSEQRGLELFQAEGGDPEIYPGGQNGGDCFHCHGGGLIEFTDHQFHNNGLDSVFTDLGRAGVTGFFLDEGLFKTPTLRNVEFTAPYMHDGRFETLHEVVEHYNSGGHNSATLDPLMKFPEEGLGLSPQDVDDLVNFLKTLSDTEFIENPDFQNPH